MSRTTQQRRASQRRHRGHRGVAYVEAVIALPFFIIVWGLIAYIHNLYGRALDLRAWGRTCTWSYVHEGCLTVPPGCAPYLGRPAESLRMSEELPTSDGDAVTALMRVPTFGAIARPMADPNNASSGQGSRDLPRPTMLGGSVDRIRTSQGVLCNEVDRRNPASIGRPAFCNLVPSLCR